MIEPVDRLENRKLDRLNAFPETAALDLRMTIKLGSMLIVGFGLAIAAMRLWMYQPF